MTSLRVRPISLSIRSSNSARLRIARCGDATKRATLPITVTATNPARRSGALRKAGSSMWATTIISEGHPIFAAAETKVIFPLRTKSSTWPYHHLK